MAGSRLSRFIATILKRWLKRYRIIRCFVHKRFFMLPRHSRQYTPSSVPNPSLDPDALDILVCLCVDVGDGSSGGGGFPDPRFGLNSFTLFRYLIDELVKWTGGFPFTLPCSSSLRNASLLFAALWLVWPRLRLLWVKGENGRQGFCFLIGLRFRFRLQWFFMLPPSKKPMSIIPLVFPDALLDPTLLNDFIRKFVWVHSGGQTACSICMSFEDPL
jgi:hypothetical protein